MTRVRLIVDGVGLLRTASDGETRADGRVYKVRNLRISGLFNTSTGIPTCYITGYIGSTWLLWLCSHSVNGWSGSDIHTYELLVGGCNWLIAWGELEMNAVLGDSKG